MKTITCDCGNNIQLDFSNAAIIVSGLTREDMYVSYYTFRCSQCGQQYQKEVAKVKDIPNE